MQKEEKLLSHEFAPDNMNENEMKIDHKKKNRRKQKKQKSFRFRLLLSHSMKSNHLQFRTQIFTIVHQYISLSITLFNFTMARNASLLYVAFPRRNSICSDLLQTQKRFGLHSLHSFFFTSRSCFLFISIFLSSHFCFGRSSHPLTAWQFFSFLFLRFFFYFRQNQKLCIQVPFCMSHN